MGCFRKVACFTQITLEYGLIVSGNGKDLSLVGPNVDFHQIFSDTVEVLQKEADIDVTNDYQRIIIVLKGVENFSGLGCYALNSSQELFMVAGIGMNFNYSSSDDYYLHHALLVISHEIGHTLGYGHDGSISLKDDVDCDRLCDQDSLKVGPGVFDPQFVTHRVVNLMVTTGGASWVPAD